MALTVSLISSNQGGYSDEEFSRFWTNIASEGIFNTNAGDDFAVTESSPQAMSVDVDTGQALVSYLKGGVTWKVAAKNSSPETKTINNNTSGSNRVDAVVVHLTQDAPNALKNNVAEILVVDGDGVAALSDADINTAVGDTNWYRLADITVEHNETVIQNSDIADTREFLTLAKFKEVTVDIIAEATSGVGVTVDDWLFREEAGYVTERGSSPTTPPTGDWAVFFKSDGMYIIDDAGSATKVQTGGISTTQKAEAAAAAGEIFENTDDNNRMSWKDSSSDVHDIVTLKYSDIPTLLRENNRIITYCNYQATHIGGTGVVTDSGGHATVDSGGTTAGEANVNMRPYDLLGGVFGSDRNVKLFANFMLTATTQQDVGLGLFDSQDENAADNVLTDDHAAFLIADNVLVASVADGATQTVSGQITATLTDMNNYYIENSGSDWLFYLNGALVATLSTNIPDGSLGYALAYVVCSENVSKKMYLSGFTFSADRT